MLMVNKGHIQVSLSSRMKKVTYLSANVMEQTRYLIFWINTSIEIHNQGQRMILSRYIHLKITSKSQTKPSSTPSYFSRKKIARKKLEEINLAFIRQIHKNIQKSRTTYILIYLIAYLHPTTPNPPLSALTFFR